MKKCLTLLSLIFLSLSIFAQVDLSVSVTNTLTLKPVTAIKVKLENTEIGFSQTQSTNAQGKIIFKSLPIAGSYHVGVEDENYFAETIDNLQFRTNESPSVNLVITEKKSTNLREINVFSGSSKINTVNAEVSAQLKRKELENLPVEGRDITRSLFRLPNVTQATGFYPEAPNVSVNGANSLFNSYLIDG
ncbi:MAG TPA: hypothetical protein VGP55_15340, partial [Chitinophagaceae bacterium]|nr:hypothetical protein [Chitinophagaceae bacterium]